MSVSDLNEIRARMPDEWKAAGKEQVFACIQQLIKTNQDLVREIKILEARVTVLEP